MSELDGCRKRPCGSSGVPCSASAARLPRPATDDRKEIRQADTKRLGRAFGVVGGLFALFAGVLSTLPSVLMALKITVPLWLLGSLYEFSVGVAGLLGSMIGASFLR